MPPLKTINIEHGRPTVEEARKRLIAEIDKARSQGIRLLKIIHGYGSSGVGGSLKPAIANSMKHRKKEGKVEDYVSGDKFNAFEERSRALLGRFPQLKKDKDFNRNNPGITMVVLRSKQELL